MKTKLIILLIHTTMIHTNTVNAQHSQLKRAVVNKQLTESKPISTF